MFYVPKERQDNSYEHLCWARIDPIDLSYTKINFDDRTTGTGDLVETIKDIEEAGIRIGSRYLKRHIEEDGRFVPVPAFCSQTLIDSLAKNPEILAQVDTADFEALCAELFVRRGFKVDLFRKSRDGGIDFLALQDERIDPIILAVQVKQPEERDGKPRRSVGRPVIQQIFGAAKAWDLSGGVVISGSTYSKEAKAFAELKPAEMWVYDQTDVLEWVTKYRWNEDEGV